MLLQTTKSKIIKKYSTLAASFVFGLSLIALAWLSLGSAAASTNTFSGSDINIVKAECNLALDPKISKKACTSSNIVKIMNAVVKEKSCPLLATKPPSQDMTCIDYQAKAKIDTASTNPIPASAADFMTVALGGTTSGPSTSGPSGGSSGSNANTTVKPKGAGTCGSDPAVTTAINFGCAGKGNPILDMAFAFIRLLSDGIGLILVGSLVYAGIQYTMSRGDPQSVVLAVKRIQSTVAALVLFIFAWAILNYIIPGFFLK